MLTTIPETLEAFKSHAILYAKDQSSEILTAMDAQASAFGISSFEEMQKIYEEKPDSCAFLHDLGDDSCSARILVPKRIHVSEETIRENTSFRVNKSDRDGANISFMKTSDAAEWHENAKLLKLGKESEFDAGHFFCSTKLVAIIHHPENPENMVGFISFDLSFCIMGQDEGVTDEFDYDAYSRLNLNLSMMQIDEAHQGQGYGTAAIQAINLVIDNNLAHICSASAQEGVFVLKLSAEGQALNDSSLQLCQKALSELEMIVDCHEFRVQEDFEKWNTIGVDLELDDDWDFT